LTFRWTDAVVGCGLTGGRLGLFIGGASFGGMAVLGPAGVPIGDDVMDSARER
jgi:hypothetical protein